MGCDIHTFAEIKIDGKWHTYNQPDIGRWYELFGKMAGVRDALVKPISQPKGLPDDISVIAKLEHDYWGADAHSASWLSHDEYKELCDWIESKGYGVYNTLGWDVFPSRDCEKRLVFWFDN